MGCAGSKADAAETMKNGEIDRQQQIKAAQEASKIHLMILGTGDSGKTTLRKQLVNLNSKLFESQAYREKFRSHIINNIIDGVVDVLTVMGEDETARKIREQTIESDQYLSPKTAKMLIDIIWEKPEFQAAIRENKNKQLHLQDCFSDYSIKLKQYPTWGGESWTPTVEECIRSRARTTGIIKEEVEMDGVTFVIYDVGGQRSERRKWMHMFDHVTSVIFVAAASEYDQVLFEDSSTNRLEEALSLFGECVNSSWLKSVPTILFLNKKDLFYEKFRNQKVPLNISGLFPDAPTDHTDPNAALRWMGDEFRKKKFNCAKDSIMVHMTTATDPMNVRAVFAIAKDAILAESLRMAGL